MWRSYYRTFSVLFSIMLLARARDTFMYVNKGVNNKVNNIHSHCTGENFKVYGKIVFRPHSFWGCHTDMHYKAFENKIMLTTRLPATESRSHGRRE